MTTAQTQAADRVTTPKGRLSYPKLLKAEINSMSGVLEYASVLIFPEEGTDFGPLKRLAEAAGIKLWGLDKSKWPANRRSPFRRGDEPGKVGIEGYGPGKIFISCKQDASKGRPQVVDHNGNAVIDASECYPGRWARFSVRAYAYTKGTPGIAFGLVNVQLLDHDDALGGAGPVDPANDFGAVQIAPRPGGGTASNPTGTGGDFDI